MADGRVDEQASAQSRGDGVMAGMRGETEGELGVAVVPAAWRRGRGATINPPDRYARTHVAADGDALDRERQIAGLAPLPTTVTIERPRRIITRNDSPDIPFDRSINPYRGCEHGCLYCYARPSHAYLGFSPGLDFETRLIARPDAPALLKRELARPDYVCRPIALGTNTDPYQPIERRFRITRGILRVCLETEHPVTIVTKSDRVLADRDILAQLAVRRLVKVAISVTTLDRGLARLIEPRAATPARRLAAIRALAEAGVPVGVMVAPVIPGLTDHGIEAVLEAAAAAGAQEAGWTLLRLPQEVRDIFYAALAEHSPERARRVRRHLRAARSGRDNDPRFGHRMRGHGPYVELIARRFALATRRLGLNRASVRLETRRFRPPVSPRAGEDGQLSLFG